jgi:hypothetical protein
VPGAGGRGRARRGVAARPNAGVGGREMAKRRDRRPCGVHDQEGGRGVVMSVQVV